MFRTDCESFAEHERVLGGGWPSLRQDNHDASSLGLAALGSPDYYPAIPGLHLADPASAHSRFFSQMSVSCMN